MFIHWVLVVHKQKLSLLLRVPSSLFLGYSLLYWVVSLLLVMESSKVPGDSEECCSSESGWTMYIASPVDDDNDSDDDDHSPDKTVHSNDKDEDYAGSDDSMASDASSGPSHRELPYPSNKGSRVSGNSKHSVSEDQSKYSSGKKPNKKVEKKTNEKRIKGEKEVPGHNATSAAASYGQGEAKVRKNNKTEGK